MLMECEIQTLTQKASKAKVLRLFLDYDGTLAEFAPSPDIVLPNKEVIFLLEQLVADEGVLPAVISGRRLDHIQKLLPVPGLLMGGTYGIEMQLPNGDLRSELSLNQVRPKIERLLPYWQKIIANKKEMYLEDKGYSLALHGRLASQSDVEEVLAAASDIVEFIKPGKDFRLCKGDSFLELVPRAANKHEAVQWVLNEVTPAGALIVYLGDDDKDEEAFSAVLSAGGIAVRVSSKPVKTLAQYRLQSPLQVRDWLRELLAARQSALLNP